MVWLGAYFNRRRLMQIRNNRVTFFSFEFFTISLP